MLIQRILSALFLVPLVVLAIWCSTGFVFLLLSIILIFAIALEWSTMFGMTIVDRIVFFSLMVFIILFSSWFWSSANFDNMFSINSSNLTMVKFVFSIDAIILIMLFCFVLFYNFNSEHALFKKLKTNVHAQMMLGVVIIIPFWWAINLLKAYDVGLDHMGSIYILIFLMMVWLVDTAAYFSGKAFGRNKLIPHVSPGKTWEGVLGSFIILLTTASIINWYFLYASYIYIFIFSMIIFIFAVFGDLLESVLKRIMHVKDSGRLIPGHGGILDRLDSIVTAIPVYYLMLLKFYVNN